MIDHDYSTESKLALNFGLSLAQDYQAELHLLHVLPYAQEPQVSEMTAEETAAFKDAALHLYQVVPPEVFLASETFIYISMIRLMIARLT